MKLSETAALLTMAAAFDNRTVGEANVAAWHSVLTKDMRLVDAVEALKAHFASSLEYLRPAHINVGVAELRKVRLRKMPTPDELMPMELKDDDWLKWRDAYYTAAKDGSTEPQIDADKACGITRTLMPAADPVRMQRILARMNPDGKHVNHPMKLELNQ